MQLISNLSPKNNNYSKTNPPIRGMSRHQAATYIGVSPSLFDELVKDGRMPQPIRINSRTIWDIRQLDEAFGELGIGNDNEWDNI